MPRVSCAAHSSSSDKLIISSRSLCLATSISAPPRAILVAIKEPGWEVRLMMFRLLRVQVGVRVPQAQRDDFAMNMVAICSSIFHRQMVLQSYNN